MPDEKDKTTEPEHRKPAVSFETEGEYLASVDRKSKKRVEEAASQTKRDIYEALGLDEDADLSALKKKLEGSKAVESDLDKLRKAGERAAKENAALSEQLRTLSEFRVSALKSRAIMRHSSKVVDPEALDALLGSKLVVDDKGEVVGPDGKSVDDVVAELLTAKPYLKQPDFVSGAGTSKRPAPGTGNGIPTGQDNRPLNVRLAEQMAAQLEKDQKSGV